MSTTDPFEARQKKLEAIRALGVNPYPEKFEPTHKAQALQEHYASLENGMETEDRVTVAGRIMALRNDGMFIDLHDTTGKIQVFCHKDTMGEACLRLLPLFDLGDIVGATGTIRRTPRGELSVRASEIAMLTKTTIPLPEKYHGLSDVETRYRQRYVDLIVNDDSLAVLRKRARMIDLTRRYLQEAWEGVEVETPILQPIHGGAAARPFMTHHNALDATFYMRIANELYLKRLMVGGFADCVFEIGHMFRNEGVSIKHNPEYTAFELYMAFATRDTMMAIVEGLVQHLALELNGSKVITYQGKQLDTTGPWKRISMIDSVKDATGIDFRAIHDDAEARREALRIGVHVQDRLRWGEVVAAVFEEKVEGSLEQPCHIIDHPLDISPLAKQQDEDPRLTSRFESYINGWEVGNGFSELNDPAEQRRRFELQMADHDAGNDEAHQMDEDFVTALGYGMPPTGGLGMGLDRLAMILTDTTNIRDVINFPTLRPIKTTDGKAVSKPQPPSASMRDPALQTVREGNDRYLDIDENTKRFVVVVNEKIENMGKLMNAVGHAMAGLAGGVARDEDFCFVDYTDASGTVHPSVSHHPVIVLKAKNAAQIFKIREEAKARGLHFTNFADTMAAGSTRDQLVLTREQTSDQLNYMALCLWGDTATLKDITGKLSLYR